MRVYTFLEVADCRIETCVQASTLAEVRSSVHEHFAGAFHRDYLAALSSAESLAVGVHLLGESHKEFSTHLFLVVADIEPPETDPSKVVITGHAHAVLPDLFAPS